MPRRPSATALPAGVARCTAPFVATGPEVPEDARTFVLVSPLDGSSAPRRVAWMMTVRVGDLLPATDPVVLENPASFEQR